jgi:hypothetical protein
MDKISDFDFEVLKLCIKENDRKSYERLRCWIEMRMVEGEDTDE